MIEYANGYIMRMRKRTNVFPFLALPRKYIGFCFLVPLHRTDIYGPFKGLQGVVKGVTPNPKGVKFSFTTFLKIVGHFGARNKKTQGFEGKYL